MDKVKINNVTVSHSKYGIKNVPTWNNLKSFNNHTAAIAKQNDWQMYFPMEALIEIKNTSETLQSIKLIRLNRPVEITL